MTENEIETFAIELFERPCYDYVCALSTASDRDNLLLKTMSVKVRINYEDCRCC